MNERYVFSKLFVGWYIKYSNLVYIPPPLKDARLLGVCLAVSD